MSQQHNGDIEYGYKAKTLQSYVFGLGGSLLLTLAAFGAVYFKLWEDSITYVVISVLAIIQLVVQSVCFLRLNATATGRWNLFPFLFVLLIIAILVGGSFWIMYNLNYNMLSPQLAPLQSGY